MNKAQTARRFHVLHFTAIQMMSMAIKAQSATNHHAPYTWIRTKSEPCSFSTMVPAARTAMRMIMRTDVMCRRCFMVSGFQLRCKSPKKNDCPYSQCSAVFCGIVLINKDCSAFIPWQPHGATLGRLSQGNKCCHWRNTGAHRMARLCINRVEISCRYWAEM